MRKLKVIERKGQRVLTTEQLAIIYKTTTDSIKKNFSNHKNKFLEGKHYYFLQGKELKEFKSQVNNVHLHINKFASSLYLWTERGANRHCKILDTDKAWEQFDNLEETYFRVKEKSYDSPNTLEDIMICTLQGMKEVKQQLNQVSNNAMEAKEGIRELKEESPLFGIEMEELQKSVRGKGIKVLGGYHTNAYNDKSLRTKVYSDIQRELKRQFGVNSYKAIKRKELQFSLEIISTYKPPFALEKEIQCINNQIALKEVSCSK